MLLNDFLYKRSVIKNIKLKSIIDFTPLIPKSTIYNYTENPYEKDEFVEEIKDVFVGGDINKDKKNDINKDEKKDEVEVIDDLVDDLVLSTEHILEKNEELSDKNRELLEENKKLKEEDEDEEDKEDEEESIFKPKKESEEEFRKKTKKALLHISKQIDDQDGGEYNTIDKDKKEVIFDNISKEGGKLNDEDVKNIVVSFF
tara:strand:+ start:1152 stop:1754 length:603 start_codon:yes stop_codon:yes gene_type:complete